MRGGSEGHQSLPLICSTIEMLDIACDSKEDIQLPIVPTMVRVVRDFMLLDVGWTKKGRNVVHLKLTRVLFILYYP